MISKLGTFLNICGAFSMGIFLAKMDLTKIKEAPSLEAYLPITEIELGFLAALFILCLGLALRFKDILTKKTAIEQDVKLSSIRDDEVKDLKLRIHDISTLLDQAVQTRMDAILEKVVAEEVNKQLSGTDFTPPVDFEIDEPKD